MKQQRYYQGEATVAVRDAFKRKLKGVLVVMATGMGKTVLFVNWAKLAMAKGGRVLVLVDRDVLCDQAAEELKEFGMHPLVERGVDKASPMSALVVGSIQTMQGDRLLKWNQDHFALVILDEAHKSAASTFRNTLNRFRGSYHVGVTATPNRPDKRGLWDGYQEIVYEFPLKSRLNKDGTETLGAVEDGWLCDPEFTELPVPITLDDRVATKKSLTEAEEAGIFDTDNYLQKVFTEAAAQVNGYKSLYFWNSCRNSKDAAECFRSLGLEAMHIDGYLSKNKIIDIIGSKKEKVAGWFNEGPRRVLCNCDLLGVGYNQPDIELIGLGRIYKSTTAYLQAIGRGTRVLADVDSYPTKELRLEAIKLSAKPKLRVIDLAIQNTEHNLATPACLVTDDPRELEAIKKAKKGAPMSIEEMKNAVKALRASDGEASRRKLAEDLANAAEKRKRQTALPYLGHILRKPALPHWKQATSKQVWLLKRLGFTEAVPSAWHASRIIDTLQQHASKLSLV